MKLADQPSDFGTLVTNAYSFFKPLFRRLIWIIVTQYLVLTAIGIVGGLLIFSSNSFAGKGVTFLAGIALMIAFVFAISFFLSAQFARAYGVMWNNESFITKTWEIAKNRYIRATGLTITISLLFIAISLGFFLIAMLIGVLIPSALVTGVVILTALFAFVYLGIRFYLSMPLLVVFDQGVFQAIKQSWHATHGRFWKTFGVLFLVVSIPTLALMGLQLLLSGENIILALLRLVVSILGNITIMILSISAIYVLLNDYLLRGNLSTSPDSGVSTTS